MCFDIRSRLIVYIKGKENNTRLLEFYNIITLLDLVNIPELENFQVLLRAPIGQRPLIRPVHAWCYKYRGR